MLLLNEGQCKISFFQFVVKEGANLAAHYRPIIKMLDSCVSR